MNAGSNSVNKSEGLNVASRSALIEPINNGAIRLGKLGVSTSCHHKQLRIQEGMNVQVSTQAPINSFGDI